MRIRFLIILLSLLSLVGCVSIYNPATGKKEFYLFDDKTEVMWGNLMAKQFVRENKMIKDEEKLSYVRRAGKQIAQKSHRNDLQYHFYIIDDKQLNAFAVPGGHVFIYKGLLDKVNEDELAFIFAHEIGHICARHGLKRLQANLGFTLLSSILLKKPDQASARRLTNEFYNIISLGYSRQDEFQADSLGLEYAMKSGYEPKAAISLFEMFKKEEKELGFVPFYLRSHPYPDQRIKNIENKLKELNPVRNDFSDGVNYPKENGKN